MPWFNRSTDEGDRVLGIEAEPVTAVKVGVDFGDEEVERKIEVGEGESAFEVLEKLADKKGYELVTKKYDFGVMVEAIDGRGNSRKKSWIYFVNGKAGEVAADQLKLKEGDVVEWRYVEPDMEEE